MHLNKRNLIIHFVILFCCIKCESQPEIAQQVNLLVQKERHDSDTLYKKFRQYGVHAIPHLIDVIDKNEKGFVGFGDPMSSYIYPYHFNYVGIRAAYLIEYILADTNSVRIYYYGIIEKKGMGRFGRDSLSLNDMKAIKTAYTQWWEKRKQQPLKELNKEWKSNDSLTLSNSHYVWR
jgi:hypothetical protein